MTRRCRIVGGLACAALALAGGRLQAEDVTWTNAVGVSVAGNSLTKTGATGWNAGASSTRVLGFGYGYVEFTATEATTYRICGLSNGDSDQSYTDVDFGILVRPDSSVAVYEGGTYRGDFGTYASGDRFRVEVRYGAIRYVKNGLVFYTSTSVPRYPLRVDSALYDTGATLTDVRVGSMVWTNEVGIAVSGERLTKTGTSGWNAGASSADAIDAGDGFVEFVPGTNDANRVAGLGNGDSGQGYEDVTFGIHLQADGTWEILESGVARGNFGSYLGTDLFRVEVLGGTVRYLQNGETRYTSTVSPASSYPLRVDTSFDTPNAIIDGVTLGKLLWTGVTGASVTGTGLVKTAAEGWNASAASSNHVDSGDGYLEFTVAETNTRRLVGLKSGASAQSYLEVELAILLTEAGNVEVLESGVSKGQFGSYANGDRLRIEVQDGVPRYRKNGVVFYSSTATLSYPFHGEAALYTAGATLGDAGMGEIVWTNETGVQIWGNSLVKTATDGWGNSGAVSTKTIESGFAEFTASERTSYRIFGLSNGDSNQSYTDLDFGILIRSDGSVGIYEAGTHRGDFGTYVSGDRFRVEILDGGVKYRKNGSLFYTSTVTPVLPLRIDNSLQAGTLLNAVLLPPPPVPQLDPPTFSPPAGNYSSSQPVTINAASGSTIRYTTDGSDPTEASAAYTAPVTVDQNRTLKAKAWKTGWSPSEVATAAYTLTMLSPGLSPSSGTFYSAVSVMVSCPSLPATIHYTLNGSDPTESDATVACDGSLSVTESTTVKASAWRSGWLPSSPGVGVYTLKVAMPTLSPSGGPYSGAQTVTAATTTGGATLHFTTNGAEPTESDPSVVSGGTLTVDRSMTLKVKGWRTGWVASDTGAATYWLSLGTVTTPTLSPLPGTYTSIQSVTITGAAGATFRYTTDGSEPNFTSPIYLGPLPIDRTTELKVRAFKADMTPSASTGGLYRIDVGIVDSPRFTGSSPGTYTTVRYVTVTSETAGATIHYTIDGRDPLETDPTVASGGTITVDRPMWLKAKAFKTGIPPSSVVRGFYRITGAVATGVAHMIALKADGSVWAWGLNSYGQLGDPGFTGTRRATPDQVVGLTDIVAISGGGFHGLALKRDGTVWAWGRNDLGQLGDETTVSRATAAPVLGLTGVVSIAGGVTHSMALKADGTASIWGHDGLTGYGAVPAAVVGLAGISKIAAGYTSSAVKTDGAPSGQLWSWGTNPYGGLGDGTNINRPTPVAAAGLANAVAAAVGDYHALAVDGDAHVWSWGRNASGELGDGSGQDRFAPALVPDLERVVSVAADSGGSFALRDDRAAFAAGLNNYGALGTGDPYGINHDRPTKVVAPEPLIAIASFGGNGSLQSSAVTPTGRVVTWGNGYDGQLGNGATETASSVPLTVPDFSLVSTDLITSDTDGDGLSNEEEAMLGSDPGNTDTNGDGIIDSAAVRAGISATNPDMDGDGRSNADEAARGTDPFIADTDGDGHNDGQDCFPLDPTRWQCLAPDPNDHTPPVIMLQEPTNATLISSVPPP